MHICAAVAEDDDLDDLAEFLEDVAALDGVGTGAGSANAVAGLKKDFMLILALLLTN